MHWEALEGSSQLELATTMSMLSTKGSPVGTTPCQHQMGATQEMWTITIYILSPKFTQFEINHQ
jgi:hypothetical protein